MFSEKEQRVCKQVFAFFEKISQIPHGSGHTGAMADYLVSFAKKRGLSFYRDGADNVLIRKGASVGYEEHPTVVLQGHTDMVLAKTPACTRDLLAEGLDLYRDGDFLRARETTLGADDGIAVAYALAILDATDLAHPPIEALFTSDEEIGLLGAAAFDATQLQGRRFLNIDSDGEGIFTVGCAGGARVDLSLSLPYAPYDGPAYRISVSGLLGGHSGMEIVKGRANAIRVLAEVLSDVADVRLLSFDGGHADNAIPTDAAATVGTAVDLATVVAEAQARLRTAFTEVDPGLRLSVEPIASAPALSAEDTARVLALILRAPNGVIRMSDDIEGLVETSLNAGIARLTEGVFSLTYSVRSSSEAQKKALIECLGSVANSLDATISTHGAYPAWEYRRTSPLRDTAVRTYERLYGKKARTMVIHAGLECGVFAGKIADFDAISFGPDNYDLHTPDERLSIPSTVRVYEFILALLAEL